MFAIDQFTADIALQVVNVSEPLNYKNAMYWQFVLVGIWIIIVPFLSESPCEFHILRREGGKLSHRQPCSKRSLSVSKSDRLSITTQTANGDTNVCGAKDLGGGGDGEANGGHVWVWAWA
jgi:hypothetical protein